MRCCCVLLLLLLLLLLLRPWLLLLLLRPWLLLLLLLLLQPLLLLLLRLLCGGARRSAGRNTATPPFWCGTGRCPGGVATVRVGMVVAVVSCTSGVGGREGSGGVRGRCRCHCSVSS